MCGWWRPEFAVQQEELINELIQNNITPEEFFERLDVIYYPSSSKMEVTLRIKEFHYQFSMSYDEENWQFVYGSDMSNVYLWPEGRMRNPAWKMYYMYTPKNKKGVEVFLPEATEELKFSPPPPFSDSNCFQIYRAEKFPAFVKYSYKGVTGFLPIEAEEFGSAKEGKTAFVSLDIGHATTSISLSANSSYQMEQQENDRSEFVLPASLRVAGTEETDTAVNYNFIRSAKSPSARSYIKNMLHSFQNYNCILKRNDLRRPIESGEILFDGENYLYDVNGQIVSYISFEYDSMHQRDREMAHIFVEQLLMFAAYQAYKQKCSYLDICYTHEYEEECAEFGGLEELYNNALQRIQNATGIMKTGQSALHAVPEYEALAYYVYRQVQKEYALEGVETPADCAFVGVNIGWKSTWMSILGADDTSGQDRDLTNIKYYKLNYGGRNISLMDEDGEGSFRFKSYYKMLGILLSGGMVKTGSVEEELLNRFKELYDSAKPFSKEYYQGVFDSIAMKIEENGYVVSPDVCNNAWDFRFFIAMVTYNILLLLICIASILGKVCSKKKVRVLIGGNGSKLFQWVSNHKYNYEKGDTLKDGSSRRYWILSTENTILEYMHNAGMQNSRDVEIRLVEDAAKQMIDGCDYWRASDASIKNSISFTRVPGGANLSQSQYTALENTIAQMEQDLFAEINIDISSDRNSGNQPDQRDAVEIIEERRKKNCKQIIEEIESVIGV